MKAMVIVTILLLSILVVSSAACGGGTPESIPTPISGITPTPEQTCVPYPYGGSNLTPEPGAEGVPITTGISIVFVRPPGILELQMEPAVETGRVDREVYGFYSDKATFYPARPLQPETTYTVTVTYGQEQVQPGYCRTSTTTWQFTTGPE